MDVLRFVMLLFDSIPLFSRFFVRYQFFVSYFKPFLCMLVVQIRSFLD